MIYPSRELLSRADGTIVADDASTLLRNSGLVSAAALDVARKAVADNGGTIGEHLVASGAVTDAALTELFRAKLRIPQVDPNRLARVSPSVIAKIPPDLAIELRVIPVGEDREGGLTVAMGDPANSDTLDEVRFFTGVYVVRAVTTQLQLAWCLAHYYGHITTLGQRLMVRIGSTTETKPAPARPRSITGRVNAARHKAVAPVSSRMDVARPSGASLDPGRTPDLESPALPAPPEAVVLISRASTAGKAAAGSPVADPDPVGPPPSQAATKPAPAKVPRSRQPTPPELAARAGEVVARPRQGQRVDDAPQVVIAEDLFDSTPTRQIDPAPLAARPALMVMDDADVDTDEPATTPPVNLPIGDEVLDDTPPEPAVADDLDVLVLEQRKRPDSLGPGRRVDKPTQLGIGAAPIDSTRAGRRSSAPAIGAGRGFRATEQGLLSPRELAASAEHSDTDSDTDPSIALPMTSSGGGPGAFDPDWGPPGSTIPPPVLGNLLRSDPAILLPVAIPTTPATDEPFAASPTIDMAAEAARAGHRFIEAVTMADGASGMPAVPTGAHDTEVMSAVTPPADVAIDAGAPGLPPLGGAFAFSPTETITALARDAVRLDALSNRCRVARSRDEIVAALIGYLVENCKVAAFYAVRGGSFSLFARVPEAATGDSPQLAVAAQHQLARVLDGTQAMLGAVDDDDALPFLRETLGVDELHTALFTPIMVRGRAAGVAVGVELAQHVFRDHLTLAALATGGALERLLAAKRQA